MYNIQGDRCIKGRIQLGDRQGRGHERDSNYVSRVVNNCLKKGVPSALFILMAALKSAKFIVSRGLEQEQGQCLSSKMKFREIKLDQALCADN